MSAPGEPDLARRFRRLIERHGPMPVSRFMGESNALYYASRDPLGSAGDFTTAPEITQMFGELVGAFLADLWTRARRPAPIAYVELGPGRGTLARDALRVLDRQGVDPEVHLVEGSDALLAIQREAVPGAIFHGDLADVPRDCPILLVANEFLDALPVRQLVRTEAGWRERMVGIVDGRLAFVAGDQPMDTAVPQAIRAAATGSIVETCPGAAAVLQEICSRLASQGGAALLVDYGYFDERSGSTLQAIRAHEKVDPLAHPGVADLTALVDFATIAQIAARNGLSVQAATQGEWLAALGIDARMRTLATHYPERADEFAVARDRLVSPEEMGDLFKAMVLTPAEWPDGAGLRVVSGSGSKR